MGQAIFERPTTGPTTLAESVGGVERETGRVTRRSRPSGSKKVTSVKERSRVSGKTSLTRLSIDEAVKALGIEVDVLRKRIQENSIPHERDGHGRVYVLVGAYSNLSHADHSRQRKPQDEAMIQALES